MSRRRGEIITFYSFKGGVGRSMAVANVATVLAQQGKKVLVLDFDFEAPGLHRYFLRPPKGKEKTKRAEPERTQRGVIELFKALRKRLRERLPPESYDPEEPASQRELRAIVREVLASTWYRYRIHLRNPNRKNATATLDFIAAGRFDEKYVERVRAFGWKRFYSEYAEVFPVLADELAKHYDYVLLDSRTGFTDIGSICTMVLPDKLVLVFSPNEQSLAGALDVGEQAARQRASMAGREPLPLFPLLSRLEDSEEDLKRQWVERATESFEKLSKELYKLKRCDLEVYFDLARVPHRAYYAYGEKIAAEEEKQRVASSMAQGYKLFADCLEYAYAHEVRPLPKQQEAEAERAVLEKLDDEPSLREMITRNPDDVMLRFRLADLLRTQARWQEAVEVCDEIVRASSRAEDPKLSSYAAAALLRKANCLSMLERREQELETYNIVAQRFEGSSDVSLRKAVAFALNSKASICHRAGQSQEALRVLEELLRSFGDATEHALREEIVRALVNKGIALERLDRFGEAISAYNEVVQRFGESTELVLREGLARALVARGDALGKLSNFEEAIAASDDVAQRFGDATELALRAQVARALVNKAVFLGRLTRTEEAVGAYAIVVRDFGDATELALREQVAHALLNKGLALGELYRLEDSIATYDDLAGRFGNANEPTLREHVANALVNKGGALDELRRSTEATAVFDEVVRRFGDATELALREQVARALINKGFACRNLGQLEHAAAAYDEVVRRFGGAVESVLHEGVARALLGKAIAFIGLKRIEEGIAACDEVTRRFGDAAEPALQELVAAALFNKGVTLGELGRLHEAVVAYDDVVRRFGDASEAGLREGVAGALFNKAVVLGQLHQASEAAAAYDELVRRFGAATESTLRKRVAGALNGIGFYRICEAKRIWQQGEQLKASQILQDAEACIATARKRDPQNPILLGNAGYIAFLLGRVDEARALLAEAIQRGGEDVRQAELADSDIHPLPQDEAFRALIRSL